MTIEPIGEIVETSSTGFVAQACELGRAPTFGSLVRVEQGSNTVLGIVQLIETGGVEPGSQAIVRGRSGVRDEAIYRENPDLRAVLRTQFKAMIVGFRCDGQLHQFLPPQPPDLHWSVYECDAVQTAELAVELDYFRTLLGAREAPADELIAAHLRLVRQARSFESDFGLRAGRELARLLSRDYERLSAILRRIGG